jgi:hypothetical protein
MMEGVLAWLGTWSLGETVFLFMGIFLALRIVIWILFPKGHF